MWIGGVKLLPAPARRAPVAGGRGQLPNLARSSHSLSFPLHAHRETPGPTPLHTRAQQWLARPRLVRKEKREREKTAAVPSPSPLSLHPSLIHSTSSPLHLTGYPGAGPAAGPYFPGGARAPTGPSAGAVPGAYPGATGAYAPAPPGAGKPQAAGPPGGMPFPGGFSPAMMMPRPNIDLEAQQHASMAASFAELKVRQAFMAKVLTLVFLQLAVTIGMACLFFYLEPLKLYVRQNAWPFYASWALSFGTLIALSCSEKVRRVHPYNITALGVFTLVFSFQIAAITSYYDTKAVISAFIVTAAIVLGCAALAFSKIDVTKWYSMLSMVTLAFLVVSLIGVFFVGRNWTILLISFFGAILFSAWLVIDLQMIMGGKSLQLTPDDWVFASISIYLDIVQIFLYILQIMGAMQDR